MPRLSLLCLALAVFSVDANANGNESEPTPLTLDNGPHLLIDDHLIGEQSFLLRTVNNPEKCRKPVIPGGDTYRIYQPFISVVRDAETGVFRMWYEVPDARPENLRGFSDPISHVAYTESEDGITWDHPPKVLPNHFRDKDFNDAVRLSVVDHGPDWPDAGKRYVMATHAKRIQAWGQNPANGLRIYTSPDGFNWAPLSKEPAVKHTNDILSLHWDPIRKQYIAIVNHLVERLGRIPHQSVSKDLINWEPKRPVITPSLAPIETYASKLNGGKTQFYGMSGIVARGDLLIGLVKVLQDDLNATPGKTAAEMGDPDRKAAGLGYTVLAWSRDGRTWQRDHEPFIPRNEFPGTFDHAMAWGDAQIITDDETLIYYAGYEHGHKVDRTKYRHLMLARMPRDRYVSRDAGRNPGRLVTRPFVMKSQSLTVNANVKGEARIRLLDADRRPLDGFDWVEFIGDSVEHRIEWSNGLKPISGKAVCLEFRLRDAQLFGFDLH